jgi:hypothetical protein
MKTSVYTLHDNELQLKKAWNGEQILPKCVLFNFAYISLVFSRGSSVDIETRLRAGLPGFSYQQGAVMEFFVFATASRPAVGPAQPTGAFSPEVKRPVCEADHSPPSSAEVKNP